MFTNVCSRQRQTFNLLLCEVYSQCNTNSLSPQEREEFEKAAKAEEARARRQFQGVFPFREYPEYRCLSAEPWVEPDEARLEWDARQKIMDKERQVTPAMESQVDAVAEMLREEVASANDTANHALSELRYLEDRLKLMFGTIPHLPPVYPVVEEADEWA